MTANVTIKGPVGIPKSRLAGSARITNYADDQ